MPWPGPHRTRATSTPSFPWPMEMQSSPVPMRASVMDTPALRSMWMPSVLGLSGGALIRSPLIRTFFACSSAMWKNLGFTDVTSRTAVFRLLTNRTLCACMHA